MRFYRHARTSTTMLASRTVGPKTGSWLRYLSTSQPKVRVRFAPSPTGSVHLGGLRTALFNFLFAAKHDGDFLIRIEDTDKTREVEGSTEEILHILNWAGVCHNEGPDKPGCVGPYRQSERLDIYHKHAKQLLQSSLAYPCFCTPSRLSTLRESQVGSLLVQLSTFAADRFVLFRFRSSLAKVQCTIVHA